MTPKRRKRLIFVSLIVVGVGIAATLATVAFRENMLYFFSPSQVRAGEAPTGHPFRLGGLVASGSVQREPDGLTVHFVVTDTAQDIPVTYTGILPDLFREGQGVVALGKLDDGGRFRADEVLAKHDENYMPPDVADAIKQANPGQDMSTLTHPAASIQ